MCCEKNTGDLKQVTGVFILTFRHFALIHVQQVPAVTVQVGKSCAVHPAVHFTRLAKDASSGILYFLNKVSTSSLLSAPMENITSAL